jgi:MFS family permease
MSPDPRIRWVVLAAATLGMGAAYGGISTISILIAPFEAEFGWLRSQVSLAYTLLTLGAAVGGLAAGRLADRLPTGPIAMAGAAVIGLGLMLVSRQSSLGAVQGIYLTLGLVGFSALYAPLLASVALWFEDRPGFAMGVVTAGGALGQAFVPPLFQALVEAWGWRTGCALLGVGYLVVVVPGVALIRKPSAGGSRGGAGGGSAWPVAPAISIAMIAAAALFCCMLMGVPTVHLVAFVTDSGRPAATATGLVTVLMLVGCAGRIATGFLVDRIGALAAYGLVSAVQTAAVYLFVTAEALWALYAVAAIYGFGFGGVMTALVCTVRAAVPRSTLGSAMAVVSLLAWVGMGAGGYQAGMCFDVTGSYALSFRGAAFAGLANLAALGALGLLIRRAEGARALRPV